MSQSQRADAIEIMRQRLHQVEKRKAEHETDLGNVTRMSEQISDVSAVAVSGDRTITVTAGPGGSIQSVKLTDEALTSTAVRLSAEITSTISKAVASAARKQAAIVQGYVGDNTDLLDRVLATQAESLGVGIEELREQMETEASAQQAPANDNRFDEDFSTETVLSESHEHTQAARQEPTATAQHETSDEDYFQSLFDRHGDR